MDFCSILNVAQKNTSTTGSQGRKYYSTKFEPPKKESKEKKLSNNIKRFLAQQEQEEKEKDRQRKEKASLLMQQRSPALQGKIRRMLKVTKSANKSVLADAIDENDTAYTAQGPEQPDEDDYGYTSKEASNLYRSIMDKYQSLPEEKKFSDTNKKERSKSELLSTKDRVREAILREREEEAIGRKRTSTTAISASSTTSSNDPSARHRSRKNLYDPMAEQEEEERRKRADEDERRKARLKRPAPPVMDFQKLLQLAEKKQYEPLEVEAPPPKKCKEPERLLTRKEKQELEERKAYMADRERRRQEALNPNKSRRPDYSRSSSDVPRPVNKMAPNGRIPKLNSASTLPSKPAPTVDSNKKRPPETTNGRPSISKPSTSTSGSMPRPPSSSSSTKYDDRKSSTNSSSAAMKKPLLPQKPSSSSMSSNSVRSSSATSSNPMKSAQSKPSSNGHASVKQPRDAHRNELKTREFPPKDVRREPIKNGKPRPINSKDVKTREFPPKDFKAREIPSKDNRTREFPPKDLKSSSSVPQKTREFPPKDFKTREFPPKDIKTREFPPKDIKTREFPPKDIKTREFPPKDIKTREFPPKDIKTREFPPKDLKTREFPPKDLKTRDFPPRDVQRFGRQRDSTKKPMLQKRRILDDDSEYDSEMDDFIDDDEGGDDYSKYIKEIFGYDKSRYRHLDDDIDNMETTFAQQMREEQISRKIGLMEDLEDMRMEAEEMKRKTVRKKRMRAVSDSDDDNV